MPLPESVAAHTLANWRKDKNRSQRRNEMQREKVQFSEVSQKRSDSGTLLGRCRGNSWSCRRRWCCSGGAGTCSASIGSPASLPHSSGINNAQLSRYKHAVLQTSLASNHISHFYVCKCDAFSAGIRRTTCCRSTRASRGSAILSAPHIHHARAAR